MEKKGESKVLDRTYVEASMEGRAGLITRKDAIAALAQELGVSPENIGLISMDGQSGTTNLKVRLYVYGSAGSKEKIHLRHLDERTLTKEEREKLKQERKKKAAAPAAAEAK